MTSRDNDRVLKLDGTTYAVLASAAVGDLPWGVARHGTKLYVANFGSGTVSVLRWDTLETLKTIDVGANSQPTFVQSMWSVQKVVVALHGFSQIAVIDAATDQVDLQVRPVGTGAWGLSAEEPGHARFRRIPRQRQPGHVGRRTRVDAADAPWRAIAVRRAPEAAVYGLTFDKFAGKLYVACAHSGNVDSVAVYQVAADGAFTRGATLSVPPGGSNGGVLTYSPASHNVFVTNSASGSTSVISGVTDRVVRTLSTGRDPFGVAVDDVRNLVYVGDRAGNRLYVFPDEYSPHLQVANGLASDPLYSHLYVTSRSNNTLLRLDAATLGYQAEAAAGNQPWGVAVNPLTRRVYAGSFGTGELYVYDADTLARKAVVAVGPEPTFVDINTVTNKVLLVSHAADQLVVLNGATNTVETTRATGGVGAWGLAVNPKLNYAYVAHRQTGELVTLDGNSGWTPRQTITACAGGGSPYTLAFNPVNDKLYLACANGNDVNTAVIFQASATDLVRQLQLAIGHGGDDGGGGIAVDTATGNVLFTNTTDGTATIIDAGNTVRATRALGLDPFGAAASPVLRRFWAGLRMGNNVVAVPDSWGIGYTAPTLTVTPGNACYGVTVTIKGTGFPYNAAQAWGRQIELRLGTQYLKTVDLSPNGSFVTSLTLTPALMAGGTATVLAFPVGLPGILAAAPVRVPRTDVPVILTHGVAGGTFQMQQALTYTAEPDAGHPEAKDFTYAQYSTPWLSTDAISTALWGDDRYFDVLRLTVDQQPLPDRYGRTPSIRPLDPIWYLQAPVSGEITDVYGGLYNYLARFKAPGKTLFGWAYDWRKDMSATEQELDKKIHEAMAAAGTDKVSLVVHSMGGLVVRNYILKYGTEHIDQLITFGTPYLGSVMIAKYLEIGDNMGMKLFGWSLDPREVTKMSQDFGSTYTLLPSREYFLPSPWDTGSFEGRYIYLELISDPKDPRPSNVYQMLDYDQSLAVPDRPRAPRLVDGARGTNPGPGHGRSAAVHRPVLQPAHRRRRKPDHRRAALPAHTDFRLSPQERLGSWGMARATGCRCRSSTCGGTTRCRCAAPWATSRARPGR